MKSIFGFLSTITFLGTVATKLYASPNHYLNSAKIADIKSKAKTWRPVENPEDSYFANMSVEEI